MQQDASGEDVAVTSNTLRGVNLFVHGPAKNWIQRRMRFRRGKSRSGVAILYGKGASNNAAITLLNNAIKI